MKSLKYFFISMIVSVLGCIYLFPVVLAQDKFSDTLNKSTESIETQLERNTNYFQPRMDGVTAFVYDIVDKFVFPLLIAASILTVMFGLYEIMFSGKDDIEKGTQYIIYGVIGIIIIQSAKFITATYTKIITQVVPFDNSNQTITFVESAYRIYQDLLMPFVGLLMYVVIGFLFVILLVHVMRFITSSEEDVTNKAKAIMISNVVGIMVILLAKTMVEAIYGKQEQVIKKVVNVGDIGSGILAGADFTLVASIINYVLGLLGFVILIIIITQTYQILLNPAKEDLIKKTKTNLGYIAIGLAIISLAYVIVNFVIIQ